MLEDVINRYDLLERRAPLMSELVRDFDERRGAISSEAKEDKSDLLVTVIKTFMSSEGAKRNWANNTYGNFQYLTKKVTKFAPDALMSQVNDVWLQNFVDFMRKRLNLSNLTINKVIACCRWFLRWAAANGYYTGRSHESFRPKFKGCSIEARDIIYLSHSELESLMAVDLSSFPPTFTKVRDLFVFCCFTGLRYSDMIALRKCNVFDDCIKVITKKTNDALVIELNRHSKAILAKYSTIAGERALPYISNVQMNSIIKAIGKIANLTTTTRHTYYVGNERHEEYKPKYEFLSSHCARRTFVVMALKLGIAPDVIMKWTGHSDYDAMKPYIAIVDELKRKSMNKFDLL